jgi:hypothetical protein
MAKRGVESSGNLDEVPTEASNKNDAYQTEETTLDRWTRQFKSGLFGVLYVSKSRVDARQQVFVIAVLACAAPRSL